MPAALLSVFLKESCSNAPPFNLSGSNFTGLWLRHLKEPVRLYPGKPRSVSFYAYAKSVVAFCV